MIICITGTPGTGKTKVANEVAGILHKKYGLKFKILHLNGIILKQKLWTSIDKKRKSKNADMGRLNKFVSKYEKENPNVIIESHLAHYFDADIVFVLQTGIKELKKRLEKRGWSKAKIEENLDAERVNVILGESLDIHGKKCVEVNTTKTIPKSVAKRLAKTVVSHLKNGE
ncbi:MAG: adenylate kinase family protein [Candidatus Aenigmatarchaeota archaeon]